jgi:dTMP kinase
MAHEPPTHSGYLITFEGADGSGKTTQWNTAVEWLRTHHPERRIVATRNPGGTPLGSEIRKLILTPRPQGEAPMDAMAELLLYMADRAQHVASLLRPALESGAIVLCDRFIDSSVAYQSVARGLPIDTIQTLNKLVCADVWPHATLLFDAPTEVLASRRLLRDGKNPQDRMELESHAFHAKVRDGFLQLAEQEAKRFHRIDASQPMEAVSQQVQSVLKSVLKAIEGSTKVKAG